jgi:hypothetical protein
MNNCPICGEIISPNAPTFKVSLGFGDFEEFEYLTIHRDCVEFDDPLRLLIDSHETSEED